MTRLLATSARASQSFKAGPPGQLSISSKESENCGIRRVSNSFQSFDDFFHAFLVARPISGSHRRSLRAAPRSNSTEGRLRVDV